MSRVMIVAQRADAKGDLGGWVVTVTEGKVARTFTIGTASPFWSDLQTIANAAEHLERLGDLRDPWDPEDPA